MKVGISKEKQIIKAPTRQDITMHSSTWLTNPTGSLTMWNSIQSGVKSEKHVKSYSLATVALIKIII